MVSQGSVSAIYYCGIILYSRFIREIKMRKLNKNIAIPVLLLPLWYLVYTNLQLVTDWLIDSVLGIAKGAHFTEALRFFIFEFPKVLMLLVLIIFIVGILRSFFTPERTRKALEGKKHLPVM